MNIVSQQSILGDGEMVMTVAAFDVDHTLTTKDCVIPFLRQVGGWGIYFRLLRRGWPLFRALLARDRDLLKAEVTNAVLSGRAQVEVESVSHIFAQRAFPSWLRDDVVARLRWHQSQGHWVVLVSASYGFYLRHLAESLGCRAVLSTECEIDERGILTGHLVGVNCRGPEKERRLREWLSDQAINPAYVFAYGDSRGDDEMLAMANIAYRVTKHSLNEASDMRES